MTETDVSYDWLKLVEKALTKIEQLPLLEEHFPFPWSEATQALETALQITHLQISSLQTVWKNSSELLQGLGDKVILKGIAINPVEKALFLALSERDMTEVCSQALFLQEHQESLTNSRIKEGFYDFLLLKILEALNLLPLFKNVSLQLTADTELPPENGFCVDLQVMLPSRAVQVRIVCPQTFLSAFKTYQPFQQGTLLSSSSSIEASLRSIAGYTLLTSEEWDAIQVGDFVILDRCTYDPDEEKGSVTLYLGETPLFMARIKPEGMKVLDYAFYQEETKETSGFTLTAEVGRLKIPLNQLLHLKPSDMIDLPLSPQQGVSLTISGKEVGQGELLKLGQTLGVRILDIQR